ncbi:hypothetical protein [Geomonas sp. Red276]
MSYYRLMLPAALLLVLFCTLPASGSGGRVADDGASPLAVLDVSNLSRLLDSLPPDEREEQLRDWARYGLQKVLVPGTREEVPVRHPALTAEHPGEVGRSRLLKLSRRRWCLVVPPLLLEDLPALAGAIDREYGLTGTLPSTVDIYSYRFDQEAATLEITPSRSIPIGDFFTARYGYRRSRVDSLSELAGFLAQTDDLVSFSWKNGKLALGGRRYRQARRALNLDDLAALYQAYNPPPLTPALLEARVHARYDDLVRRDARLQGVLARDPAKKRKVLARIRREVRGGATGSQVGFSLDPQVDYLSLASDIRKAETGEMAFQHGGNEAVAGYLAARRGELENVVRHLAHRHDLRPLLELRRRYEASRDPVEQRLGGLLRMLQERRSFQSARYDGNLQGTGVGMALFYTDLLAKLWALDYQNSAPRGAVTGFRKMQEIAVPKLNWNDFIRLSQTRLWFGLRGDGFDIYGDDTILFTPSVTRVYAASSDPLVPGKESKANYQSAAFLGWWDRHYEAVAAYEPYYHKLDQIQKWSCALMVLKEKKSRQLAFLSSYPVRHDLDFATWSSQEPVLARLGITFLDASALGQRTESLPLLSSAPYPMLGKSFTLSGGVSLAGRDTILAKLHRSPHGGMGGRSGARGGREAGRSRRAVPSRVADAIPLSAGDEPLAASLPGDPQGEKVSTQRGHPDRVLREARAKEHAREVRMARMARHVGPPPPGGSAIPRDAAGPAVPGEPVEASTGKAGAPTVIKLTWQAGPDVALHELVDSLARRQQTHPIHGERLLAEAEGVQKLVRVREGGAYLVKTETGRDHWMYLEVNPASMEGFTARASAARADADIFCAKLVSDQVAARVGAGKRAVSASGGNGLNR